MKTTLKYIVTEVASIPVMRVGKGDAYRQATQAGWGTVEWYSAINNYAAPVNRDREDKTQQLVCDPDNSAVLYAHYGQEFCIVPYEDINLKDAPKQAECDAIILSDSCGFSFYAKEDSDVKIFVTYEESGLIDSYRLENWNSKPYDGETEISFDDLQSEAEHDNTDRADIVGTFEHSRKMEAQNDDEVTSPPVESEMKAVVFEQTTKGWIANVNNVMVWFIRNERRLKILDEFGVQKSVDEWFIYKSEDGGKGFKLMPAECTRFENGDVDFDQYHKFYFDTLEAAKAFVYNVELGKGV